MTLAIGAKYPWGELNKLFTPTTKPPNAIILASDSRWTYKSETESHYEDVGTKLFKIDNHVGAVYAGASEVGEKCLTELRWQLSRGGEPSSQLGREFAQQTFLREYRHYIASKKLSHDECPHLYILIGAVTHRGEAELCLFEHRDDFEPKPLDNPKAIGRDNTVESFKRLLNNELKKQVADELSLRQRLAEMPIAVPLQMPIEPHRVAIIVTALLNKIIESESDSTVGGKIQCAVITAQEFSLPKISYSPDPTNEGPGFTCITPKPSELKTLTGRFGCYDLMEHEMRKKGES